MTSTKQRASSRCKIAQLVVAVLLTTAAVTTATAQPASAADVGYNCNGSVATSHTRGDHTWLDFPIEVNGVVYGRYNLRVVNYTFTGGRESLWKVAVKDSRRDGLAPYVTLQITMSYGDGGRSGRIVNRRGTGNGYRCHGASDLGHIRRIVVRGSVADAPSIPEPVLVSFYF